MDVGASAVRVLIADDQAVFRQAVRRVIDASPELESVGEAASGEEALELVASLQPDIVLMDVHMPGMGGVEAARLITEWHPDAIVLLFSATGTADAESLVTRGQPIHDKRLLSPSMLRGWLRDRQPVAALE
jgi:DNA-binding NarL/FixJ family response regulator